VVWDLAGRVAASGIAHLPRFKIDTPEMRGRRQELHTHARTAVSSFAQEDDAAFLFFLRLWIHQDQHFAVVDFIAQVQQPAMGADHQGLADLAKLLARVAAAQCLQPHLVEDALAAAL